LVLTLRKTLSQRLDLSPLTPDRLLSLGKQPISNVELECGNRRVPLGDLFDVTPGDPMHLHFVGDLDRCDRIGAGMTRGTITVDGNAGAYVGHGMVDGAIRVLANAGPCAATEMQGGIVEIGGDAGDFLGGALPGNMRGMSEGLVVVHGNAGDRAGDRMRRGTIIVEGSIGAYAASRMIAGTVIALGTSVGPCPGFAMKRGSLILISRPERVLPSFSDCGRFELGFIPFLLRRLRGRSPRLDEQVKRPDRVRRLAGDRAVGGKGEILLWQD
jgi:formylmethanofuran dehydrogenase subunit C